MKAEEIRKLSGAEIRAKLAELRQEKMNLRFQAVTGQSANRGVPEIFFGTLPIPPKIPCTFTTAFPKSS